MLHAKRYPETTWTLGFHVYKDTVEELPLAAALADKWRLKFVPITAIHMDAGKHVTKAWTPQDKELISRLLEPPEEEVKKYIRSDYCNCQSKQITISATGTVWLCQLTYEFPLGNFLEMPFKEIRRQMMGHEFCPKCKDAKGNVLQEKYGYFFDKGDPVAKAEKGRRA
jgi:MoaA/NifB/PqqE/SkfB family radical SAM enzyme